MFCLFQTSLYLMQVLTTGKCCTVRFSSKFILLVHSTYLTVHTSIYFVLIYVLQQFLHKAFNLHLCTAVIQRLSAPQSPVLEGGTVGSCHISSEQQVKSC